MNYYVDSQYKDNQTMTYDDLGNIETKTGLGTYGYSTTNGLNGTCAAKTGAVIPGPHAVRSTSGTGASYCYNANGDMIFGKNRTVTYTAFGKPATISASNGHSAAFYYSPGRDLVYRKDSKLIVPIIYDESMILVPKVTHTYILGGYEKVIDGGTVKERHLIGGVVSVTVENGDENNPRDEYLFKDHQGSTTTITDTSGNVLQRMAYDTWGKRRAAVTTHDSGISYDSLSLSAIEIVTFDDRCTGRGYTGHQMIDSVGLIHMNGRVYDPELGKFLSADIIVQEPYNPQSLNRYAYVMNNPLSAVDPSGFKSQKLSKWWAKNKGYVRVIAAIYIATIPGVGAPIAANIMAAAVADIVATGGVDPTSLAVSMFSAGVLNPAMSGVKGTALRMLGHGVIGGIRSDLTGGKFVHGFVTGALNESLDRVFDKIGSATKSIFVEAAAAGLVSGAMSEQMGGSFKNGALTGGFARLFNHQSKKRAQKGNGYGVTDEQRQLVAGGKIQEFWESRLAAGDPVARAGLASLNPEGGVVDYLFGGTSINNRLQAFANVYADGALNIDQVRVDLATAHINFTDGDRLGVRGLLNPGQIAEYHHQVFDRHGLPPTTFGGTPFTGAVGEAWATRPVWCGGCDWK
ncbi:MAG: RHS repeat-associated core domain-containing protein [Pseudomonadales bacterium]|nr:RHS repeat-associated core domain-containing protein [Pseudomonadales bacterium]